MATRIELAHELLGDAEQLLNQGRLRSATSRAYYAAYHAAVALFEHHGFKPTSFVGKSGLPARIWEHSIVTRRFFHEFVNQRRVVSWRAGLDLRQLYADRLLADYEYAAEVKPVYAADGVHAARNIVEQIERCM